MIKREDLKTWSWYLGCGRGSQVALWTGSEFVWPGLEWGIWAAQSGAHYEDGGWQSKPYQFL